MSPQDVDLLMSEEEEKGRYMEYRYNSPTKRDPDPLHRIEVLESVCCCLTLVVAALTVVIIMSIL